MYKFGLRFTGPIFRFLPTVLLAGALLILIAAPLFDADIKLAPVMDSDVHQSADVHHLDARSDSRSSARAGV